MKTAQFQIVIPAYNVVDLIDQTVQSIRQQQFSQENIYIIVVDFGSTDGTYQKVLAYEPFHLGVYQVCSGIADSRMAAEAGKVAAYTKPRGGSCCQVVLWPGDMLYPDGLERVAQSIEQYGHLDMVICETDIRTEDGTVVRPSKLYESERIIDGETEYMKYLVEGFQHNILSFGGEIYCGRCYINGQMNERVWWNKSFLANFGRDTLYIPEYLGCIRERYYADELQEILFRWDNFKRFCRFYADRCKETEQEDAAAEKNMAYYALWRSYLRERKGDMRQAEECFRFSTVLFPKIRETQIYQSLERLLMGKDQSTLPYVRAYFDKSEPLQNA